MVRVLAVLVALGAAAVGGTAQAQLAVSSGEALLQTCTSPDPERQAFCAGYIAGTLHTLAAPKESLPSASFCLPPGQASLKMRDAYQAVADLIAAEPAAGRAPALAVVAAAMARRYPCAGQAQGQTAPASPAAPPSAAPVPAPAPRAAQPREAPPAPSSDFSPRGSNRMDR